MKRLTGDDLAQLLAFAAEAFDAGKVDVDPELVDLEAISCELTYLEAAVREGADNDRSELVSMAIAAGLKNAAARVTAARGAFDPRTVRVVVTGKATSEAAR